MLESVTYRNSTINFRTLGSAQKKLLRLKNAPKLPDSPCIVDFSTNCAKFEVS